METTKNCRRSHLCGLTFLGLIVVLSHSQVTVRQWFLKFSGVQYGTALIVDETEMQDDLLPATEESDPAHIRIGDGRRMVAMLRGGGRIKLTEPHGISAEAVSYRIERSSAGLSELAWRCPGIGLGPGDLLLAVGFAVFAICGVRKRAWRSMVPPLPVVGVLVAVIWSFSPLRPCDGSFLEPDVMTGLKELVQMMLILVCGFCTVRRLLRIKGAIPVVLWTWLCCGLCCCVVGLVELQQILRSPQPTLQYWDSTFGFLYNLTQSGAVGSESSQHVFSAYLGLLLPIAFGCLVHGEGRLQLLGALTAVAALSCQLHLGFLVGSVLAVGCVANSAKRSWVLPAALLGCVIVVSTLVAVQPVRGQALVNSVALHRMADSLGLMPPPYTHATADMELWEPVQQKYLESQAALNAASFSPLVGYGAGSYQLRINAFYAAAIDPALALRKAPVNLMERDAHSQYKVALVETGVLGVLAWLWLWFGALRSSQSLRDPLLRAVTAGALVALLAGACFGTFSVRGLQTLMMVVLALAMSTTAEPGAPSKREC